MNRPRIFLSAVSTELRTARQAVAATVRTLGFDAVSQDDFPTGHGELRQWLREQIDSCEGLIQLVGQAYGAEPPDVDPEYGRVSYTQLEFLYARLQGKRTWVIIAGEHCYRDEASDRLDLPGEPGHADQAGFQAERRQLQQDYVTRVQRENHLWHHAGSDVELQNVVLRLRDELGTLRLRTERQQRRLTRAMAAVLTGLLLLGVGGWWAYQRLRHEVGRAGVVDSQKIHARLLQTVEETHRRELADAERNADWKERQRLRDGVEAAHAVRLSRIEELTASFDEIAGRGGATSVFQEMTRIVSEQGVDAAIAFVASQRSAILRAVQARAAAAREHNRADLQPLLMAAALHANKGRSVEARGLYADILVTEPDWPEALHAAFWFCTSQGDAALLYATLPQARQEFQEAQHLARRQMSGGSTNAQAQRDLSVSYQRLGDVAMQTGDLKAARELFQQYLEITRRLAQADPTNSQAQRDLGVSYERTGAVAMRDENLKAAREWFQQALAIRRRLAQADPSNPQAQYDLSTAYERLGDLAFKAGDLPSAREAFQPELEISRRLAQAYPMNAQVQRGLSISYQRLGNVTILAGELKTARDYFLQAMEISRRLVEVDPANSQAWHDLSVSYNKLGEAALQGSDLKAARDSFQHFVEINRRLATADPVNVEARRYWGIGQHRLGEVALREADLKAARESFQQALEIRQQLTQADRTNAQDQRDLALTYERLGDAAVLEVDLRVARKSYQQALEIRHRLAQADRANAQDQGALSVCYGKLGNAAMQASDLVVARDLFQQCLELSRPLGLGDPINFQAQGALSVSFEKLGDLALQTNDLKAAREWFEQGIEISRRLAQFDPTNALVLGNLSVSCAKLGNLAMQESDLRAALQALLECRTVLERLGERNARKPADTVALAELFGQLAWSSELAGSFTDARTACEASINLVPFTGTSRLGLTYAHALLFTGEFERAKELYLRFKDPKVSDGRAGHIQVFQDFETLRAKGHTHPDTEKIEALLRSAPPTQ